MPILKQGSSGPDVTKLQQKLKDLGFDPNGVDGNFGPGTRDAVIAFQQSKGLQADGIAGPATQRVLRVLTRRVLTQQVLRVLTRRALTQQALQMLPPPEH